MFRATPTIPTTAYCIPAIPGALASIVSQAVASRALPVPRVATSAESTQQTLATSYTEAQRASVLAILKPLAGQDQRKIDLVQRFADDANLLLQRLQQEHDIAQSPFLSPGDLAPWAALSVWSECPLDLDAKMATATHPALPRLEHAIVLYFYILPGAMILNQSGVPTALSRGSEPLNRDSYTLTPHGWFCVRKLWRERLLAGLNVYDFNELKLACDILTNNPKLYQDSGLQPVRSYADNVVEGAFEAVLDLLSPQQRAELDQRFPAGRHDLSSLMQYDEWTTHEDIWRAEAEYRDEIRQIETARLVAEGIRRPR